MLVKIQATRLLRETIEHAKTKRLIIHEGGSRSSKTWSIFQFFLLRALEGRGEAFTIVRDRLTWIKSTLLKDLEKMQRLYSLEIESDINVNRQDQIYSINGSEFAFFGLDYAEKLHGRRQDWFWINEGMSVEKTHFDQLEMRTDIGGIIDYNPVDDKHWIFELSKREDSVFIKSTMLDNPFLPDTIRNKILSYEPTEENIARGTADNYMWQVYGLGERARLEGVIFENWDVVDKIPEQAEFIAYGLDFGFAQSPAGLLALYRFDGELYVDELLYKTGLNNLQLVDRFQEMGITKNSEIIADSAEPKSIDEISRAGFHIYGVEKGGDSIRFGIDVLSGFKIHVTKRSTNLENELRKYKWAQDRQGRPFDPPKPVKEDDHLIDAMRYIAIMKLRTNQRIQVFDRSEIGI